MVCTVAMLFIMAIILISKFMVTNIKEKDTYRDKYGIELTDVEIDSMRLNLNVMDTNFSWASKLQKGNKPNKIIVHHAAGDNKSVEDIHEAHLENGWAGIGYHYYIRRDGSIFSGRPEDVMGAHAQDNNENTLGVCIEGNFENEIIGDEQYNSLMKVIEYLSIKYPIQDIIGHRDVRNTLCPGKNIDILNIKRDLEKYFKEYNSK